MKNDSSGIELYFRNIQDIFQKHGLQDPIYDLDYLKKFSDEIGHLRDNFNKNGELDFRENDLLQEVRNVRFAIANVILFFEAGLASFVFKQGIAVPNYTEFDTRFFYFADDAFMRFYGAWNRIGNFLNLFFKVEADSEKVYFNSIIEKLVRRFSEDRELQSLLSFKNNEYQNLLNKKRREIVHRQATSSAYFEQHVRNISDRASPEALQAERDELPQFFINQYKRLLQGIDEMLSVIKNNISGS